ncbi:MAG: type I 3-dehydroquinate dehydratase [Candidatus Cloacimonetes bacterium]|nr:type I 3-dehydroquinate dehydratase [Candidatus Cloacimonadota bacterium]
MVILSLIPESKAEILAIRKRYPDYYLEYRLDLTSDWSFLDKETVDEHVILTLRDRSECSKDVLQKKNISLPDKIKFYCNWIKEFNCLVDIEQSVLHRISIPELLKLSSNNLIISIHIHDYDWNVADLARRCLEIERSECRYTKLALASNSWMKLQGLETLIRTTGSQVLVAFMGDDGVSKRCFYRHIGAEGTYVSLKNRATVNGQMDIEQAETLGLKNISGVDLIGGIIGGKQVVYSEGLEYYNKLFRKKLLNAVYLPLIINDIHDFHSWLHSGNRMDYLYGFSITMPYKAEIAALAGREGETANLWDGGIMILNTDLKAMNQILRENMKPGETGKILLLGSGASANTVLQATAGKAKVTICSRNFPAAIELAKKYKAKYVIAENLRGRHFDILINTTPLGANNEDLLEFAAGVNFDTAIDLPYRTGGTPLGRYCQANGKKYMSGQEFWIYQSKPQENFFLAAIHDKDK